MVTRHNSWCVLYSLLASLNFNVFDSPSMKQLTTPGNTSYHSKIALCIVPRPLPSFSEGCYLSTTIQTHLQPCVAHCLRRYMLHVCLPLSELRIVDCVQFSAYIVRVCLQLMVCSLQRLDPSEGRKDNCLIHVIMIFTFVFFIIMKIGSWKMST